MDSGSSSSESRRLRMTRVLYEDHLVEEKIFKVGGESRNRA